MEPALVGTVPSWLRFRLVSPEHRYVGDSVVGVPDWSVGETFTDRRAAPFPIVSIDPARVLDAVQVRWTVAPV